MIFLNILYSRATMSLVRGRPSEGKDHSLNRHLPSLEVPRRSENANSGQKSHAKSSIASWLF